MGQLPTIGLLLQEPSKEEETHFLASFIEWGEWGERGKQTLWLWLR